MFNKVEFAKTLQNIISTYHSQREFAEKTGMSRTMFYKYINLLQDKPPKPNTLEKLANHSNNITTYQELMSICGYYNNTFLDESKNNFKNINNIILASYKGLNLDGLDENDLDDIINYTNYKKEQKKINKNGASYE